MRGNTFRPFGGDQVGVLASEDTRESDCFADEVVIDFPSVSPAVERIRRGLLDDESPATVSTAIHITEREALAGATVPLEVPVRCTCRICGGRGEVWTESCQRCSGKGEETLPHVLQVSVPRGIHDGARLRFTVAAGDNPPSRIELHVFVGRTTGFPI